MVEEEVAADAAGQVVCHSLSLWVGSGVFGADAEGGVAEALADSVVVVAAASAGSGAVVDSEAVVGDRAGDARS